MIPIRPEILTMTDTVEYGQLKTGKRNEAVILSVRPMLDKIAGAPRPQAAPRSPVRDLTARSGGDDPSGDDQSVSVDGIQEDR